jgi:hypothetical protein
MLCLIDEHWKYVEALLKLHGEDPNVIRKIGFHYKTAFQHGMKHGKEEES